MQIAGIVLWVAFMTWAIFEMDKDESEDGRK